MAYPYNSLDWYWIVSDHNPATEVFSSARHAYVSQAGDATYLAWVAADNSAITGLTEAQMLDALRRRPPFGTKVRAATFSNQTISNLTAGSAFSSITLANGDVILLGGQSTASQNGLYKIAPSGAPSRAFDVVGSFYDIYPAEPIFQVAEGSFAGAFIGLTNTSGATPALFGAFNIGAYRTLVEYAQDSVSILGGTISGCDFLNTNQYEVLDTEFSIQDDGDATKQARFNCVNISTGTIRTYTFPNANMTLVGEAATQALTNKTLDNSNIVTVRDDRFTLQDNADTTKQAAFELSGLSTGTTRTYTLPNASTTVVGHDATQTLTNKTLDNSNVITARDDRFTMQDNADTTKQAAFQLSGIATGTTRTYTLPDASTTLVGHDATQTLSNKTLTTPNIVGTSTNDNAAAGSVGELIESSVPIGSAVSLTTATAANVTSISLTAGDWDVWACVNTAPDGTTTQSAVVASISTTSATHPTSPNGGARLDAYASFTTGFGLSFPVGQRRISVSATTTVYLVISVNFAVSTCGGYGYIGARRVR